MAMDDIVELKLSRAVNTTNTKFIRAAIQDRMEVENLDGPPIELVQFHVFIFCTSGAGRHMVDFREHQLNTGTAVWIRPGQVQRWSETHDDFDADVVVFESSVIPDLPLFDQFIGTTTIIELGEDAHRLQQLMDWITVDLETHNDHAMAAAVVSVILRLFARYARSGSEVNDSPSRRLTTLFVDSVQTHIDQRSVAWHAGEIGASPRSIARATAKVLGHRPKDVIDANVILEARRRLAWSKDDIATISRDLRFSEASNFTKFFRTRTGVSPSVFRDEVTALATPSDDTTFMQNEE